MGIARKDGDYLEELDLELELMRLAIKKRFAYCERDTKEVVKEAKGGDWRREYKERREEKKEEGEDGEEKVVGVTSAGSYLGLAIVSELLARGYSVFALIDRPEEEETVRGIEPSSNKVEGIINADLNDGESLYDAFKGCRGVFHTASFIDPSGLSGYSKWMAEVEAKVTRKVIEACGRGERVKKCVLTSSLLACIWRDIPQMATIDHLSWSLESLCTRNKLWLALGKLKAEKEAWRVAKETSLNVASICPAFITGPDYSLKNSTASLAYLKGAEEMFAKGLLATVDVQKLAKVHVQVYEVMNNTRNERYICYDHVIETELDVEKLSQEMGVIINQQNVISNTRVQLSDTQLSTLISRRRSCSPY